MINLFNYLIIFNIFGGGFVLFSSPFDFYLGYIFIILFLFVYLTFYMDIYVNRAFIFILMLLTFFSLINVYLGNDSLALLLKQFVGISISGIGYYLLFKVNKYDFDKLFKIYLKIAFIVAIIGIIQQISYLADFKYGYDYSYFISNFKIVETAGLGLLRVNSILPEPAHFAASIMPATFIAILNIFNKEYFYLSKWKSLIIISSVLLSFSVVAYIGVIIAFMLIICNYKRFKYLAFGAILISAFMLFTYTYVPEVKIRVDDSISALMGEVTLEEVNLSTFALYSNVLVAYNSLINNPIFGSGLGSHAISYDKYIGSIVDINKPGFVLVNRQDANSLFLRLISETGLLGTIIVFYFILKFYVSINKDKYFWIISNSVMCLFLINLLRQGHYFYNGLFFFVWLYYFVYKNTSDNMRQSQ